MPALYDFTGCCGAEIIYGFEGTPDQTSSYEYNPVTRTYKTDENGKKIPISNLKAFKDRLEAKRKAMPNRMYCVVLNEKQYEAENRVWPKILKGMGFEFVRSWSNSNHDGSLYGATSTSPHPLYLFVLCTDDKGTYKDHNRPPPGWAELPAE